LLLVAVAELLTNLGVPVVAVQVDCSTRHLSEQRSLTTRSQLELAVLVQLAAVRELLEATRFSQRLQQSVAVAVDELSTELATDKQVVPVVVVDTQTASVELAQLARDSPVVTRVQEPVVVVVELALLAHLLSVELVWNTPPSLQPHRPVTVATTPAVVTVDD
jgi:hypothetical protein